MTNFDSIVQVIQQLEFEESILASSGASLDAYIFTPNYLELKQALEDAGYMVKLSSQAVIDQNNIAIAQQTAANLLITIFFNWWWLISILLCDAF